MVKGEGKVKRKGKTKLEYIFDNVSRKLTFKRRKKGFYTKLNELRTLCDVRTCAVMYTPFNETAMAWPNEAEARQNLTTFKSLPERLQNKKMLRQEEFMQQMLASTREKLITKEKENKHLELAILMDEILKGRVQVPNAAGVEDFASFVPMVAEKIKAIEEQIQQRDKQNYSQQLDSQAIENGEGKVKNKGKAKLEYISDNAARKTTFNRRTKGFYTKLNELTTLCDVRACAVMYTPYNEVPMAWPSEAEARQNLTMFKWLPEQLQNKKMISQEEFMQQVLASTKEKLVTKEKENKHLEVVILMDETLKGRAQVPNDAGVEEFASFTPMVAEKIKLIEEWIQRRK